MRIKRNTIILGSIGVVLLLLSTQTTIAVVQHKSVKNEVEGVVNEYDVYTIIELLKDRLENREQCGCEEKGEWEFPIICSILYLIILPFFSFFLFFGLMAFYGHIHKIYYLFMPLAFLFYIPVALLNRMAWELNCFWKFNLEWEPWLMWQQDNYISLP